MKEVNEKIKEHYDRSQIFYNLFWLKKEDLGMHYGFWYNKTKNLHNAIINENKAIVEKLKVEKSDVILDAGCGIGGSTIWMAKNYNVKVVGITLSMQQSLLAKKYAEKMGLSQLVEFYVKDFCDTKFSEKTFTKIFAIESICHTEQKENFIKEAFRILKPGGILVVADFFVKEQLNQKEKILIENWCNGWEMQNLATIENFKKHLASAGFNNIGYENKTKEIMPSSKRMLIIIGYLVRPILKILEFLKLRTPHGGTKATISQYYAFKNGSTQYCIFWAKK